MERGLEIKRASGKAKGKKELKEEGEEEEEEEGEEEKRKRGDVGGGKKGSSSGSGPFCQAEKCTVDLTNARRYHRRHRVCEHHSKEAIVLVAGLCQRFCQQCSRFHELSQFDEAKRSCRSRLAGHNERRRKSTASDLQAGEGAGARKEMGANLKESLCMHSQQGGGKMSMTLPASSTYQHFQIR